MKSQTVPVQRPVRSATARVPILALLLVLLGGCAQDEIPWNNNAQTGRWYSPSQIEQGKQLFAQNCAQCHGRRAQGAANWTQPDAQGLYPPPPLDGSAHAWHHPYAQLVKTISEGSRGTMPAWGDKLTREQISSLIAYFQSYWPDQGYQLWLQRHKR